MNGGHHLDLIGVASNPQTPAEMLRRLGSNRHGDLRWALVRNLQAPLDFRRSLVAGDARLAGQTGHAITDPEVLGVIHPDLRLRRTPLRPVVIVLEHRLGEHLAAWEVAMSLLPGWSGSLQELADASMALVGA